MTGVPYYVNTQLHVLAPLVRAGCFQGMACDGSWDFEKSLATAARLGFPAGVPWVHFLDTVDYQNPDRGRWTEAVQAFRPHLAVVPDIYEVGQLEDRLSWMAVAEAVGCRPILVPKSNVFDALPRDAILGYSVPSTHGASTEPIWRYAGFKVHLLGGSPLRQVKYGNALAAAGAEVVSVDGNSFMQHARYGVYFIWRDGRWFRGQAHMKRSKESNYYWRCVWLTARSLVRYWSSRPCSLPVANPWGVDYECYREPASVYGPRKEWLQAVEEAGDLPDPARRGQCPV